ncbi:hypothetical protein BDW59DRAFT_111812 [Aspergillus cavernicola]|uniref:Uncharacterized protein n=1 Tax=Aspergillus cavernicola TaxID=176166 RepID=A0ABR4HZZ1_9EURO
MSPREILLEIPRCSEHAQQTIARIVNAAYDTLSETDAVSSIRENFENLHMWEYRNFLDFFKEFIYVTVTTETPKHLWNSYLYQKLPTRQQALVSRWVDRGKAVDIVHLAEFCYREEKVGVMAFLSGPYGF